MIKKQFGLKIKEIRKNSTNLSQEAFANYIGLDRTYYSSVENGERNISIENIYKIAKGFNMTLSDLFLNIENIKCEEK